MSTAELFVEALDTVGVLLRAGATWFVLVAVAASLALFAVLAVVGTVVRWAWTAVRGVLGWRQEGVEAAGGTPEPDETPEPPQRRPRPSWACEQPTTYDDEFEEAA